MHKVNSLFGWFMWLLAAAFYALDYFQHTAPSVLIHPMAQTLHLNVFAIGNIMSVYFPIYAISQIPAGYLLDRVGYRFALPCASLIISVGIFITAGAQGYPHILIGRILVAVGSAFAFIGALKVASVWLSDRVFPIAVGITNTIGVLGGIFGQVLLNYLIMSSTWSSALVVIGIFGIFLGLLMFFVLRSPSGSHLKKTVSEKITFSDFKVLKSFQIWTLGLYAGIMVGTVVVAFGELYSVLFIEDFYKITSQKATIISSLIFIGIAVGGPTHGAIASILKNIKFWLLACNGCTIILFILTIVFAAYIPVWSLYYIYFLLGFFVSSMLLAFGLAKEIFPKEVHGISMAFVNMIIGLAGAVFQPLAGAVLEWLNKGNAENVTDPQIFIYAFYLLIIPLCVSFIFGLCIKSEKKLKLR